MGKAVDTKKAIEVFERLSELYPDPSTELTYENPFQLLIAVILSAQCTDARVNQVTPHLFARYPSAQALAQAKLPDVERIIHSCGFYRAKARAITTTAKDLTEKYGGAIPDTLEQLTELSGVGRKTASVVLNQAFGKPAIAVDTHVKRVSYRLGWTDEEDPEKIEWDLRRLLPEDLWSAVNGTLILHGRRICNARKPLCDQCPVRELCRYYQTVAFSLQSQ